MTLNSPAPIAVADEDVGVNTSTERPFASIVATRVSRRDWLRGAAATAITAGLGTTRLGTASANSLTVGLGSSLTFT